VVEVTGPVADGSPGRSARVGAAIDLIDSPGRIPEADLAILDR
jgi:hypothetical protein